MNVLVLCDPSTKYGMRFVTAMRELLKDKTKVTYYQDVKQVKESLQIEKTEVVIFDETVSIQERKSCKADFVFVLTSSKDSELEVGEWPLFKYQAIDTLLNKLQAVRSGLQQVSTDKNDQTTNQHIYASTIRTDQLIIEAGAKHKNTSNPFETDSDNSRIIHPALTPISNTIESVQSSNFPAQNEKTKKTKSNKELPTYEETLNSGSFSSTHQNTHRNTLSTSNASNTTIESMTKLIAVYSPIHRIGKTRFAIELGQDFSRNQNVLYLNLEGYSGNTYFKEHKEQDIGSLVYYARQDMEGIGLLLTTFVGQIDNLDYVEPAFIANELSDVKFEDWEKLLIGITSYSIYDVIVIDIGEKIQGLFALLGMCDTIYTPYIEEPVALSKLKQYTDNLIRCGYSYVLENTIQKKMQEK